MTTRTIELIVDRAPKDAGLGTALSHALLREVADGRRPETLRLHRPDRIVAFGRQDALAPGYREAVRAAEDRGFAAVERLAGGRAAVFHRGTIAFSWAIPDPQPRERTIERFEALANVMVEAFRSLGVDARVGEVPGEYCPGAYSVNASGRRKVMGTGQRLVSGAAHVGGVVVVNGAGAIRDVLIPVYRALELSWDPATAGALASEAPDIDYERAEQAIVAAFGERYRLVPGAVDDITHARARALAPDHRPA